MSAFIHIIMMVGSDARASRWRSERDPAALVVDIRYGWMARGGVVVEARGHIARFALALASRPSASVSSGEIEELLWGDREDGDPDRTDSLLTAYWPVVQGALTALGYAAVRRFGRGFQAWPVERWQAEAAGDGCVDEDVLPQFLRSNA